MIIVWFKRDLRVSDHLPLTLATQHGRVLPLYIIEPSVMQYADYSTRHYQFVRDSLLALRQTLSDLGQPLVVRVGEALEVMAQLHREHTLHAIYAHEETGNALTFERDNTVRIWAQRAGIRMVEIPSGGVVRRLKTRDEWSSIWETRMAKPVIAAPEHLQGVPVTPGDIPVAQELGLGDDGNTGVQKGGERAAHTTLHSFLTMRGAYYHKSMSSPLTAFDACSRLSPYLAWGNISVRQVFHALQTRQAQVRAQPKGDKPWGMALSAFESRLHWRDHFIQKLEDAPRIEQQSFITTYDGIRDDPATDHDAMQRYTAWRDGHTGYPLVDACMRAVQATGYLNFRMRAMVVSFASHDLWLDWRTTGWVLARWFTDMEPGIHWSQMQMQSGTSGTSTLRIYNPTNQAQDHDAQGVFIRRWLPELRKVPVTYITAPHLMPLDVQLEVGVRIGTDYPMPIVAHDERWRAARAHINAVRKLPETKRQVAEVLEKHGSRKRPPKRRKSKKNDQQPSLFDAHQLDTTP